MTQSIEYSIDWLQYAVDWPSDVWVWPLDKAEENVIARTCAPNVKLSGSVYTRPADSPEPGRMTGYPKRYDLGYCTVHVDPNRKEQKIGVRFTGDDMRAYRACGGTEARLLDFIRGVRGKVSRIDLAIDFKGYAIDVLRIYDDWLAGKVSTRARRIRPLSDATKNKDGSISVASTLYFGSRTSAVMVRIYEKGKQLGTGEDWVRVELEVKDDRAEAIAQDCARLDPGTVAVNLLRDYIPDMPYKFWRQLEKLPRVPLTPITRKQTERQAWLFNVVLPLLQAEINDEWNAAEFTGITEAIEALVRKQWTTRANGVRQQYGHALLPGAGD